MGQPSTESSSALLVKARLALGILQKDVAELLGVSARTMGRWTSRGVNLTREQTATLARAVHPKDASLASRIAAYGGETLETLGILAGPAAGATPPATARTLMLRAQAVDAVVCSAADALDISPRAVRPAVLAAVRRAREAELTLEDVETVLAGAAQASPPRASQQATKTRGAIVTP